MLSPPPSRWTRILAPFGLPLSLLIMFGDLLFGGSRVLSFDGGDLTGQFLGWRQFGFGQLRSGHFPFWNPHLYSGTPFFAGFQSALLYPINWVHLFLPTAAATNWEIALNLLCAGGCTYIWARSRRLHPLACLLAGLTYMWSGAVYLHVVPGHLANLAVMAWAPLLFCAIDRAFDRADSRGVIVGSVAIAVQVLGGHPQYVFYSAIGAGIYCALNLFFSSATKNEFPRPTVQKVCLALALMSMLGLALSAVQLFPGLLAAQESARARLELSMAGSISLPPENVITFVLPGFFGQFGSVFWGRWVIWEMSIFVGVVPLALSVIGQVYAPKSLRRFSTPMILLALLLAFGSYTPLFRVLYEHFPGFASFRAPAKFNFLVTLFIAMLTGVGLDHLIRAKTVSRSTWIATAAFSTLCLCLSVAIHHAAKQTDAGAFGTVLKQLAQGVDRSFYAVIPTDAFLRAAAGGASASVMVAGIAGTLLTICLCVARKRPNVVCLVVLLAAGELVFFDRTNRPTFDLADFNQRMAQIDSMYHTLPADSRQYAPIANLAMNVDGHDIWGDDPMVLERYATFIAATQGLPVSEFLQGRPLQKISPALGLLRLGYARTADGHGLNRLPDLPTLGRGLLLNKWRVIPDEAQALASVSQLDFDPRDVALLDDDPNLSPAAGTSESSVQIRDVSPDKIQIDAITARPSILVITDNFSPGWSAIALSGSAQDEYRVIRADYTLRGIPLTGGTHHILLTYRPPGLVAGIITSVAALLLVVTVFVRQTAKSMMHPSEAPGE